jgi:hypothetical protein
MDTDVWLERTAATRLRTPSAGRTWLGIRRVPRTVRIVWREYPTDGQPDEYHNVVV